MSDLQTDVKVGDLVIMESAGGWGYNHDNNGCIAAVHYVGRKNCRGKDVPCISGEILNPNVESRVDFVRIPLYQRSHSKKWTWRQATPDEIAQYFVDSMETEIEI